jgi:mono/diheme cytochrome c family protein
LKPARALVLVALGASVLLTAVAAGRPAAPNAATKAAIARGRYLVVYGNCNDCHTPGWRETDGKIPESRWLTGTPVGFRGSWGTSYPTNVRLDFAAMSEDRWLLAVRTRAGHPPMDWEDLRALSVADQRAIYVFVRSLGSAGVAAPDALPPWRDPAPPYIDMRAVASPAPSATP